MSRSPANITLNPAALRLIRQRTGLGVTDLARESGLTPSYISNLEAGRRTAVSPSVFVALCAALRISDQRALMAAPAMGGEPAPVAQPVAA